MNYSEQDMAALISEVEAQFAEHLAKSEAKNEEKLAKSEEVTEEVAAADEQEELQASEEEVQKSEETEAVDFDYDEEDIEEMHKLYASMTKSEAEAHLASIQKALGVKTSTEEVEESVEMTKSETEESSESLLKSELDSVKKDNEELKKSIEKLTAAMTSYVKKSTAPKQKAISGIEYIAKSEEPEPKEDKKDFENLSKSEISQILTQKIRSGKLEKSDKEKVNQYYLDNTNIETIKHLLD